MDLPAHAPGWARPLVAALMGAGFEAGDEVRGGMAGYSVALSRDDCKVTIGGDRGDFDVTVEFPNPRRGRGRPRVKSMPAEDYVAAVRGDTDASLLLSDATRRNQEVASWLAQRVTGPDPLGLDEKLLEKVGALQRERAKSLFG